MGNDKTIILMSGLSQDAGKMAKIAAEKIIESREFDYLDYALTGSITDTKALAGSTYFGLIKPYHHGSFLEDISRKKDKVIIVDYSQPDAVNRNAELYCKHKIPFVMGTTGGDRKKLEEVVQNSEISAVIAPNMAKQIVALQDFMDNYSKEHEGALKGCKLSITESHQAGKKDTSGTAIKMIEYFNRLGIDFKKEQINMIRDPTSQIDMGISRNYLSGHGWHEYTINSKQGGGVQNMLMAGRLMTFLSEDKVFSDYLDSIPFANSGYGRVCRMSKDGTVGFSLEWNGKSPDIVKLSHNVNGRDIYAEGTIDAIRFLNKKFHQEGNKGKVYSMIDVLKEQK